MAGFATHGRLGKSVFFQVSTHGVAATAFFGPGALVPVRFAIIGPGVVPGVILNRRDIEPAVFFDQIALFPLDADDEFYLLHLRNINLIQRYFQLFFPQLQIQPNLIRINCRNHSVPILSHVLKCAAVEGHLPGIVVLQVADFALFRTDVRLWTGHDFLDLVPFWTTTNQSGGK